METGATGQPFLRYLSSSLNFSFQLHFSSAFSLLFYWIFPIFPILFASLFSPPFHCNSFQRATGNARAICSDRGLFLKKELKKCDFSPILLEYLIIFFHVCTRITKFSFLVIEILHFKFKWTIDL